MSPLVRAKALPSASELPPLSHAVKRTFCDEIFWAATLRKDSVVYRYGSSKPQLTNTRQQWLNVTEDLFHVSEDVLDRCSLLDMTSTDHGERDVESGHSLAGTVSWDAWNTAALRGDLRITKDLLVWAGIAAPMAFDRKWGNATMHLDGGSVHSTTAGGATQILIQQTDQQFVELLGSPALLKRVRQLH